MKKRRLKVIGLLVSVAILYASGLYACKPREKTPVADARGEPDSLYTIRGRVESVPKSGTANEFQVRHEAIPEFVDFDGNKTGMSSMSMPFPLAKGVSLDGVNPGDIVELTFAMWRRPKKIGFEVRQVTRLPPETALDLGGSR